MENTIKLLEENKNKLGSISKFKEVINSLQNLSTSYKKIWIDKYTYAIQKNSIELIDKLITEISKRNNIENPVFFF